MGTSQPIGIHATSSQAIERAAQLWSDKQHAATFDDDFSAMSFIDLESLADDLSESSQWSLLDDVRGEITTRIADARTTLTRLFVVAMENADAPSTPKLPWVTDKKLDTMPVSMWAYEELGTVDAQDAITRVYCAGQNRILAAWRGHIAAMGVRYANDTAEDLLRSGWQE